MEDSAVCHGWHITFVVRLLFILGNASNLRSHLDRESVILDAGFVRY